MKLLVTTRVLKGVVHGHDATIYQLKRRWWFGYGQVLAESCRLSDITRVIEWMTPRTESVRPARLLRPEWEE